MFSFHQTTPDFKAEAVNAARRGQHVMLTTATSSGKSLCFLIPTLEAILCNHEATAILLFPTKALAHDQFRVLKNIQGSGYLGDDVRSCVVDGDTLQSARSEAQSRANIILTNPDLIHASMIPHHHAWRRVIANIK